MDEYFIVLAAVLSQSACTHGIFVKLPPLGTTKPHTAQASFEGGPFKLRGYRVVLGGPESGYQTEKCIHEIIFNVNVLPLNNLIWI